MALSAATAQRPHAAAFLARHSARTLAPLYPEFVREKRRQQASDRQIATQFRQRFPQRAARLRTTFQPPDISRTYILEPDGDVATTLAALRADPDVEYAEEDKIVSVSYTPNDPYFNRRGSWGQNYDDLWGLKKIGAPAAWDTSKGEGIVVAVLDTGIDYNHPDISANIWTNAKEVAGNGVDDDGNGFVDDVRGWNFVGTNNNPIDDHGHGTHVAGTIAAVGNNGLGVIGVAWRAKVMLIKAFDSSGAGLDSVLARAIVYAANQGADVINNSWGGPGESKTIAEAVAYAHNLGAVIVAAAGNNGDDAVFYHPGDLSAVITVAASDRDDMLAGFSNWGSKIDVAAPGVNILSLRAKGTSLGMPVDDGYTRADGTSMAAPHVAGLAALLLAQHPEYSNEQVRQAIRASATGIIQPPRGIGETYETYGRIESAAALALSGVVEAKIGAPASGAVVRGPTTIAGVARGRGFAGYKLEYCVGKSPEVCTLLQTGAVATSGTLGVFDAGAVMNGVYSIRLTVYNGAGQAFVDNIQLTAAAIAITSPAMPSGAASAMTFKPGVKIPISGTANATGFGGFHVDWARGMYATKGWQTGGISLESGGASPITEGLLAAWETPALAAPGYYTIRLRVVGAGFTNQITSLVYLEPDLLSAEWPKWLDAGPYRNSGVVPARNADGSLRLLVAAPGNMMMYTGWRPPAMSPPGALWTLPLNGPPQRRPMPLGKGSHFQPSAASLDGGTGEQAVVGDLEALHVYGEDGAFRSIAPGVPHLFARAQVLVEDIEGDSRCEILAFGDDPSATVARIYAWRRDGSPLNGNFPIEAANHEGGVGASADRMRLIAGDIDGDGSKELVVQEVESPSTHTLKLFDKSGSPRAWNVPWLDGLPYAMAAADLDRNGKLEIILVSNVDDTIVLHVFQPDGSERAGFPKLLPNSSRYCESFLAVGDVDRDGHEEIVLAHDSDLYVFRDDGALLSGAWPLQTPTRYFGSVVIGDIDGDERPEIVTSHTSMVWRSESPHYGYSDQKLLALRADGSVAKSWQLTGMGHELGEYPAPAIGDFNQDGSTEIAVAYGVVDYWGGPVSGVVTLLATGAPFHSSANDWPMVHQNARNTAVRMRPGSSTSCIASISPGEQTLPAAGGIVTIEVAAPDGCSWTASSALDWVTITGAASGSGKGSVRFQVKANAGALRAGNIIVAGWASAIRQKSEGDGLTRDRHRGLPRPGVEIPR